MRHSAFADLIPPVIARRPKKGFEMPIGAWLRMREEVRTSLDALPPMFERGKVDSIVQEQAVERCEKINPRHWLPA